MTTVEFNLKENFSFFLLMSFNLCYFSLVSKGRSPVLRRNEVGFMAALRPRSEGTADCRRAEDFGEFQRRRTASPSLFVTRQRQTADCG